jgi:type IV fimbrial biogenesis protein FimT
VNRETHGPLGFSLVELLVSVAVIGILALIGIPSYQTWIRNSRIRTAAESIQNGLRIARSEASQRGANVRFEFNSASGTGADWKVCALGTATTCSDAGTTVIQSYSSNEGAADVRVGADTAIGSYTTALTSGASAGTGVTFTALGRPSAYGTNSIIRIDASNTQTNPRRLVVTLSSGGLTRMCDPQLALTVSPQGCQ